MQSPAIEAQRASCMSSERKYRVWQLVKKNIPIAAKKRKESIKRNARYCKLCIIDAFNGRLSNGLANNSPEFNPKKTEWEYNLFCLNTSEYVYNAGTVHNLLYICQLIY